MSYKSYEGHDLVGMVLRLERSSIHDGPGLRTVVFLKGCPLRCQWCSTPESQKSEIEKTASNTYGMEMTVEEVLYEVRKDIPFYFNSHGGMTLSGGELMAQPEFSRCLLQEAQDEGIHTATESTLFASRETVQGILRHVDLAMTDLKFFDQEKHKTYCGVSNERILDNMLATNDMDGDFAMVIRVPLIPGVNDDEEELSKMAQFTSRLERVDHVELLPYHKLGTATYEKLGRPYLLKDVEVPTADHMEECRNVFRRYVDVKVE